MTISEAVVYLSSLRVTALSSRNEKAVSALQIALDGLCGYECGCGHSRARHTACEVKICGCSAYHSRLTVVGSATEPVSEASGSPGRSEAQSNSNDLPLPPSSASQSVEQAIDALNDIISKYGEVLIEGETGDAEVVKMDAAIAALVLAVDASSYARGRADAGQEETP